MAYVLRVWAGGVSVEPGTDADADVTVSEDYDTALAIHEGRLSAAAAVAAGRVHVSGAVARLLERADVVDGARG